MTLQKLNLGMKQQLNMTAGLFQSINILQMSNLELSEMLANELASNPFLEDGKEFPDNEREVAEERYDNLEIRSDIGLEVDPFAGMEEEKSLISYVTEQINSLLSNQGDRIVAMYLLNYLQDSGYIEMDMAKFQRDLKISEKHIITVLQQLQKMAPTGIFARNLQECLSLQLREQGKYNHVFEIILENLAMVATHTTEKLAKLCSLGHNELMGYIKILKSLNPKPCAYFMKENVISRVADVILYIDDTSGEIKLRLNDTSTDAIRVSKDYYALAKMHTTSQTDKDAIASYYYRANNIMRSISQRMSTIKEVATAIAEKQREFFLKGVMYLKPMTLAEIAYKCGLNESTVSRATSNKYIETPTGIYDLKFFFSSSVQSKNNSGNVSSTKVKEIIKSIIDLEDQTHIYSDEDIVEALTKFNINIARRTVAKYRDTLGIETSNIRKRKARSKVRPEVL